MGSVKHQQVLMLSLKVVNIIILQIVLKMQFNRVLFLCHTNRIKFYSCFILIE